MTLRLPAFPWDTLAPIAERAREHPDGVVDLSVGTPVDPTPDVVQRALCEASPPPSSFLRWRTRRTPSAPRLPARE